MKKCIYFGPAENFWYSYRFKEFMDSLDYTEELVENNFTPMANALKLPLLYYSHFHNVVLKHERDEFFNIDSDGAYRRGLALIRAKVTLFGKEEIEIEDLEWLIKEEAKKLKNVDNLKL